MANRSNISHYFKKPYGVMRRVYPTPDGWLRALNRGLLIVLAVVAAVTVYGVVVGSTRFAVEPLSDATESGREAPAVQALPGLGDFLRLVGSKDLFAQRAAPISDPVVERAQRLTAQEIAAELTLIGVVAGDEPVAIIHNARTNKTVTLRAGEHIDDLLVSEIRATSVILTYAEETVELKL